MSFFRSKAERQLTELKKFNETFQNLNSEKNYDSMISACVLNRSEPMEF
jgi:hypothetical protein